MFVIANHSIVTGCLKNIGVLLFYWSLVLECPLVRQGVYFVWRREIEDIVAFDFCFKHEIGRPKCL